MHILICPDKFKGSLSATQVCDALEKGIYQGNSLYEVTKLPLADGGEGTLDVLQAVLGGELISVLVNDPLFRSIKADYLWMESRKKAFIEMSRASGLPLLSNSERDPLKTTSFGTGQLILDALERGATDIVLTVGGSATNDAGIGMAAALGYAFLDENGNDLAPIGENLIHIQQIIPSEFLSQFSHVKFQVATDVENPLNGPEGAAFIFAAQKGGTIDSIRYLDNGLNNIARFFDQKENISQQAGAGAAGGLGAGANYFLQAEIISGSQMVLEAVDFNQNLMKVDFVITGEGKIDEQTWYGKLVAEVLKRAQKAKKPCVLICGMIENAEIRPSEFQAFPIYAISDFAKNQEDSMLHADQYLHLIGETMAKKGF
ncbi:glycerate kinase [Aquirufa sp. ROCK-SH2]